MLLVAPFSSKTFTSHRRDSRPHADASEGGELPDDEFEEIERLSDDEKDDEVGDEEGPSAVLVGGERKPPDVAQSDRHGDAGK